MDGSLRAQLRLLDWKGGAKPGPRPREKTALGGSAKSGCCVRLASDIFTPQQEREDSGLHTREIESRQRKGGVAQSRKATAEHERRRRSRRNAELDQQTSTDETRKARVAGRRGRIGGRTAEKPEPRQSRNWVGANAEAGTAVENAGGDAALRERRDTAEGVSRVSTEKGRENRFVGLRKVRLNGRERKREAKATGDAIGCTGRGRRF